jgi:hypothetical protein
MFLFDANMKKTNPEIIIAIALITATIVTPYLSLADVDYSQATYVGEVLPQSGQEPPTFEFSLENGSILYTKDVEIELEALINWGNGTLVNLYNVTYKADWQDTPTIIKSTINDPATINDDEPNGNALDYNIVLTDVPEGSHQIEVVAVGGGAYSDWNAVTYQTFTITGSSTLDFTVETSIIPNQLITFAFVTLLILVIGLLVYFKKRKH